MVGLKFTHVKVYPVIKKVALSAIVFLLCSPASAQNTNHHIELKSEILYMVEAIYCVGQYNPTVDHTELRNKAFSAYILNNFDDLRIVFGEKTANSVAHISIMEATQLVDQLSTSANPLTKSQFVGICSQVKEKAKEVGFDITEYILPDIEE